MRWVRSNRRIGACIALFALALQLILSFGHLHHDGVAHAYSSIIGVLPAQTAVDDGAPSDPDRRSTEHDFCAICATISLASTLLLPGPPPLVLPISDEHKWRIKFDTTRISFALHILYQSRAPPVLS